MGHSNKLAELEELAVKAALVTNDPVERHIIECLQRLRYQNKRLKTHIEKTRAWPTMKAIDTWMPFDFYNYFCTKFKARYGREYNATGNIVAVYSNLQKFYVGNGITKSNYKDFIDKAFEKYFNKVNAPRISAICNKNLYEHLMGEKKLSSSEDFRKMDQEIMDEAEKFERKVAEFNAAL